MCRARQIGNCSVLYFKAGYCFVFVNYNGKLRRRKRIFSYITEKYGTMHEEIWKTSLNWITFCNILYWKCRIMI